MKRSQSLSALLVLLMTILSSCEDQIEPTLEDAPALLVIDAWLTNQNIPQNIRITQTQSYFDNSAVTTVEGADVSIEDSNGRVYQFIEDDFGNYQWRPTGGNTFGEVGLEFELTIALNGKIYSATSTMTRVPEIDSISFRFEEEDFVFPDSYWAEFWSRDPLGPGDTYWIKTYKNGEFLSNPDEINIAFDAGFSEGGNIDGLIFIPPIRDAINPLDEVDDEFVSPYKDGDNIRVELHSITNEAFTFLNELALQINRPGGFAELFATPLSNVPTNIVSSDPNETVAGFFNVSAVSTAQDQLDVSTVPLN